MDLPDKEERKMTSAHGNRILLGAVCVCLIILSILSAQFLSAKKSKLRFLEKKYSETVSSLELHNQEVTK